MTQSNQSSAHGQQQTRRRVFLTGFGAILFFAAVQFILLLSGNRGVLKPLDPGQTVVLQVTRVLDPDLPALSSGEYDAFLRRLEARINQTGPVQVKLEQGKTVVASTLFSDNEELFRGDAADRWLGAQALVPCDAENRSFSRAAAAVTAGGWVDGALADSHIRPVLERHYAAGTLHGLRRIWVRDFMQQFTANTAWKDLHGGRYLGPERDCRLVSAAHWGYLLHRQTRSDLLVANIPVVLPAKISRPEVFTRGGLTLSLLVASKRPAGGAVFFSTAPFTAERRFSPDRIALIAAQPLQQMLQRCAATLADSGSLFYPVLGNGYSSWLIDHGSRDGKQAGRRKVERFAGGMQ